MLSLVFNCQLMSILSHLAAYSVTGQLLYPGVMMLCTGVVMFYIGVIMLYTGVVMLYTRVIH